MKKRSNRNLPHLVKSGDTAPPQVTPPRKLKVGQPFAPRLSGRVLPAPEWIVADPGLSNGAKLLWQLLAFKAGGSPTCWPSREVLAKEMGRSIRQVERYGRELARTGRVEISVRKPGSNLWTLVYWGPSGASGAAPFAPGRHHSVVQQRAINGRFNRTETAH